MARLVWTNGWLCVREKSPLDSAPTLVANDYPVHQCTERDFLELFDPTTPWRYDGDGRYVGTHRGGFLTTLYLKDGGSTRPLHTQETPIARPTCRVQTRWECGRWEKYLKTAGWVPA